MNDYNNKEAGAQLLHLSSYLFYSRVEVKIAIFVTLWYTCRYATYIKH